MTNADTCTKTMVRGVGRKKIVETCGKAATFVTMYNNGLCIRHANTKAGKWGQKHGTVTVKNGS